MLAGNGEDVLQPLNIDSHGQRHVLLPNGTEEGREMDHPIDSVSYNKFAQMICVHNVCILEKSQIFYGGIGLPDISNEYGIVSEF